MTGVGVQQTFPMRGDDGVVTHKRWNVDLPTAAVSAGIPLERMTREASDMAQHFPRWMLTVVRDGVPLQCKCDGLYVFDQGTRCVQCSKPMRDSARGARAGWFGVLPPIGIDSLTRIKEHLVARPPRRHVVGERAPIGTFMLVPLVVVYSGVFPRYPLDVHYMPEFRTIPGIPRDEYSHAFHMIGQTRMCLFASDDWQPTMTAREVLQQRAYPHVIKFLNYANGKHDAFRIVS